MCRSVSANTSARLFTEAAAGSTAPDGGRRGGGASGRRPPPRDSQDGASVRALYGPEGGARDPPSEVRPEAEVAFRARSGASDGKRPMKTRRDSAPLQRADAAPSMSEQITQKAMRLMRLCPSVESELESTCSSKAPRRRSAGDVYALLPSPVT
ncbi:hypothetical protein EYF80_047061 [Liparis tanakae]|uniref:Uncharacterized protein n=1 Tax=Liparis tanakae TaxID=230148 RepID=A0A4Z2FPA7_9TELE|nr:hypothetical protein EYF80_047061 [Liparis tanakae]